MMRSTTRRTIWDLNLAILCRGVESSSAVSISTMTALNEDLSFVVKQVTAGISVAFKNHTVHIPPGHCPGYSNSDPVVATGAYRCTHLLMGGAKDFLTGLSDLAIDPAGASGLAVVKSGTVHRAIVPREIVFAVKDCLQRFTESTVVLGDRTGSIAALSSRGGWRHPVSFVDEHLAPRSRRLYWQENPPWDGEG